MIAPEYREWTRNVKKKKIRMISHDFFYGFFLFLSANSRTIFFLREWETFQIFPFINGRRFIDEFT